LARGADPNSCNAEGKFPLYLALENQNQELVVVLLQHGANPKRFIAGKTLLAHAASNFQIAQLLLEWGAEINHQASHGDTALHWACLDNNLAAVKNLLQLGAKPNIQNQRGETPLYVAMKNTTLSKELIAELLEHKADPNIRTNTERAPLACNTSSPEVTKMLIEAKADVNYRTANVQSAAHMAIVQGHMETLRILYNKGAKSEVVNQNVITLATLNERLRENLNQLN
jgi:uncharacterized protein